ncbi:MAG: DUF2974 domain-containing protein [Lachnospira sp.]|nr:DUF2974 domain-containing protein [Lachnospira sp.]
MALSNYQLVLLDNIIYLNKFVKIKEEIENRNTYTIADFITDLLVDKKTDEEDKKNDDLSSGEADDKEPDNGEIDIYWKDELKQDQSDDNPGQCLMNLDEWKAVLTAIKNDKLLMSLKITNVFDSDSSANPNVPSAGTNFRAACFSNDEETVIVFRGTHGAYTWNDNGEGGYQADTASQQEALYYVNLLGANLTTSGKITVTGHSKGGNLAQYVTICAANLVVDRCVSFDGQGFSNEDILTSKIIITLGLYAMQSLLRCPGFARYKGVKIA